MKKRTPLYILLLTVVLYTTGCKKFLYQEPYNSISVADIFKDFEGARTTLVSCYDNLKSTDHYLKNFILYPDITGGNLKYTRTANQTLLLTYNFNNDLLTNDMLGFYKLAYANIYNTNTIIANINNITDASTLQKNRFLADAYCIRALEHFDLARVFAQSYSYTADASHPAVVIRNALLPLITPAGNPNTCKELFDQVTRDLDSAILLYPNSVNIFTLGDSRTYFSIDAAKALQSRVALYKNDWNRVVSLCTEIIGSNKYPLISNSNYVNSWTGQTISSESIFELAYGNRTGGALGDYYNTTSTISQLASTNDILNLFSAGDIRGSAMHLTATVNSFNYSISKKYQGINTTANSIKILRASELYLNRAEANAENNNLTAALADLNIIRKRANPTATDFVSTDKQTIINEILNERRRELCFEGHLFFDISRKKQNLVRNDCSSTNCSFTYPNAKYACTIPLTN